MVGGVLLLGLAMGFTAGSPPTMGARPELPIGKGVLSADANPLPLSFLVGAWVPRFGGIGKSEGPSTSMDRSLLARSRRSCDLVRLRKGSRGRRGGDLGIKLSTSMLSSISASVGARNALVNDLSGTKKPPRLPLAAAVEAGTLALGAGAEGFFVLGPNIRENTLADLVGSDGLEPSESSDSSWPVHGLATTRSAKKTPNARIHCDCDLIFEEQNISKAPSHAVFNELTLSVHRKRSRWD